MRLAYDIWPTLHESIGAPTGYERPGGLRLIERDEDDQAAQAHAWAEQQQDIPTRVVSGATLREMEPDLSDRVVSALYCPKDGFADHTMTTQGLAGAAQKLGAVVRERTAAASLERSNDRIAAVITAEGERIPVGRFLLLASNGHVPELLKAQFGLTLPVWRVLLQVVLTEPVSPASLYHLIGHSSRRVSMKPNPDGRVMISGGWRGRWNPDGGQGETVPEQVEGNVAEAVAVYPALDGVQVSEAVADRPETQTADGIPIIDRVPGTTNAAFVTGSSGHGWAIAPAVSRLMADWAFTGQVSPLLRPFSYSRFTASSRPG